MHEKRTKQSSQIPMPLSTKWASSHFPLLYLSLSTLQYVLRSSSKEGVIKGPSRLVELRTRSLKSPPTQYPAPYPAYAAAVVA
jgi:hypothetical protein